MTLNTKMNKEVEIPVYLQELFGKKQSLLEIILVVVFGALASSIAFISQIDNASKLALWRKILAFIILFDIAAGCIANFTKGTNRYYIGKKKRQYIFLSVHFHIIFFAWVVNLSILPAILIWAYSIITSFLVVKLNNSSIHIVVAGFSLGLGVVALSIFSSLPLMNLVGILFMVKLIYSFAVDHYRYYSI